MAPGGSYLVRKKNASQFAVVVNDNGTPTTITIKLSSGFLVYAKTRQPTMAHVLFALCGTHVSDTLTP